MSRWLFCAADLGRLLSEWRSLNQRKDVGFWVNTYVPLHPSFVNPKRSDRRLPDSLLGLRPPPLLTDGKSFTRLKRQIEERKAELYRYCTFERFPHWIDGAATHFSWTDCKVSPSFAFRCEARTLQWMRRRIKFTWIAFKELDIM